MTHDNRPDQAVPRPLVAGGDPYGTHRGMEPRSTLPQQAWRLDNDFTRIFAGEMLVSVETLNIDAASFTQMEEVARAAGVAGEDIAREVAHIVVRTVSDRGKQHNPVTGSGGMLLGRVLQVGGTRADGLRPGDRIASLVSLSLTPLRIDAVVAVRLPSAQIDVMGEAILFESGAAARLPEDLPERVALAALDVAGAAPQVARIVSAGQRVVLLGAGGKSGVLCAAEARRRAGPRGFIVGVEASERAAADLRSLALCDAVVVADARDAVSVRRAVLEAGGGEADVTISCVSVPDAEMSAILVTRDRGVVYFFAMSTSFTRAALGAEGAGKDVDLFIGNGFAHGHAEHTLSLVRDSAAIRGLFERRYG